MPSFFPTPLLSPHSASNAPQPAAVDRWHASAEADYRLACLFAERFDAKLDRTEHSQRVGWDRDGRSVYGILLPDPLPPASLTDADWYIYYVWGETLFRRTRKEREKLGMLVLPSGVEDWAQLLRRAIRHEVFDVRYEVTPQYVNALGEVEMTLSGYEFTLSACAPPTASTASFQIIGAGETPEAAAREACTRWLRAHLPDADAVTLRQAQGHSVFLPGD